MDTLNYINGLHHVTALASSAKANLAFYTQVLGLKLIKKTINYDAPEVYHLYYGDAEGNPGTVLTFFPYEGLVRGRAGAGQVTKLRYSVAPEALSFWIARFQTLGLTMQEESDGFGNTLVGIADPDGLVIEIVADADDMRPAIAAEGIPAAYGLKGFHSALMVAKSAKVTNPYVEVLTGYSIKETRGNLSRWHAGAGGPGSYLDIVEMPDAKMGLQGAGSVHHIAFRTPSDATEAKLLTHLHKAGISTSPITDRNYFHSIYFREAGGVLFEIATENPGFAIDEDGDKLGQKLLLPPWAEASRAQIEAKLQPLN